MAKILSLSLPEEHYELLQSLEKELSFSGRSELIRAGLQLLNDEHKNISSKKGKQDAILLVSHKHSTIQNLHTITHDFHDIIKTQTHSELENHKCLDILLLKGNGKKITELYEKLLTEKKLEKVKLLFL